jgi:hypothetical protein
LFKFGYRFCLFVCYIRARSQGTWLHCSH